MDHHLCDGKFLNSCKIFSRKDGEYLFGETSAFEKEDSSVDVSVGLKSSIS